MGVSSSLYASISGLSTMGNAMSVLGDNVSNVNTIAFKSSRATFQDVLSQSVATAAGAAQVGRGVTMTTIDGIFAQGSFESTSTATDLAIGGQGFFMLRAASSAEADMYTRAGEFRFDKEGFLVNPTGNFVQGWTLDTTSGERQGTIGDINLGKTTPPVQTTSVQVIANVDSRKNNETTEQRLFDAWNGTNPALPVPVSPIDAAAYEYTTAIKVYDSVGASHDLTVYFDRTTEDNQWEFLVTCEPSEDQRILSDGVDAGVLDGTNDEASIYVPETTYNYANPRHKGAGALLYGVLDFSTSGAISSMWAWNVPPDGAVDPAQSTNLLRLENTDQYYSFAANFTGAQINQQIELNLGARYSGAATAVPQVLVSDGAAYATGGTSTPITKETLWSSVFDNVGTPVTVPDSVTFAGYNNSGATVGPLTYSFIGTDKVQDLLDVLDDAFGCTTTIDAAGRIKMTDATGGPSGLAVTSFFFNNGVNPFGGGAVVTFPGAISGDATHSFTDVNGVAVTDPAVALNTLFDGTLPLPVVQIANGDVYQFSGTAVNGNPIAASDLTTFTVGNPNMTTVQNLLTFLSDLYADGVVTTPAPVASPNVSATLGADGRIRIVDNTSSGNLAVRLDTISEPLGSGPYTDSAMTTPIFTTFNAVPAVDLSLLTNVYDVAGLRIKTGDVYTFTGNATTGASSPVSGTFTVGTDGNTVQDLMNFIDGLYDPSAGALTVSINLTGRIEFADTSGNVSISIAASNAAALPLGVDGQTFGAVAVPAAVSGGQINIATAKQQVVSTARALTTLTPQTPITATTSLASVLDSAGNNLVAGDILTFVGKNGDDGDVSAAFTVGSTVSGVGFGPPLTRPTNTVRDLLSWLELQFNAEASIDGAGRLVLTDRVADDTTYTSKLAVTSITNDAAGGSASPFGATAFTTIAADVGVEDGSLAGQTASIIFSNEALSTTQYANSSTTIFQDQNGFAAGFLQSVSVDTAGIITGNYSNGQVLQRAQVALASFNNLAGLRKEGGNVFRETSESGAPITGPPATNGLGTISPNSLEQSNVDLGAEFVKLITTQRGFQANSKIITTTDEMLQDLINIKR